MPSLDARLLRLEKHAEGDALCTDPRCLHMEFLRLDRRVHGFPEYPLPPHPKNPDMDGFSLAEALSSLNRQPGESAEDCAERMRPQPEAPYVDPYFGAVSPQPMLRQPGADNLTPEEH